MPMKLTALRYRFKTLKNEPDYFLFTWDNGVRATRGFMFRSMGREHRFHFYIYLFEKKAEAGK